MIAIVILEEYRNKTLLSYRKFIFTFLISHRE